MELNKWYKGNELPDRECDCVVISQDKRTEKTIEICQCKKTLFGKIFINPYGYPVPQASILFYMPIEFPKEVS